MLTDRRARLFRFIARVGDPYNRYQVRIGLRPAPHACLSDASLEILVQIIAFDFWSDKKANRVSRAAFVAARAPGSLEFTP